MNNVNNIRLLVRGDDIGSSHSANLACIKSYTHGIVRSLELMTVCSWFEEACILLNQHPKLDVGIHLTLTSEWEGVKWKPITSAASLTEDNGCFFPMLSGEKYYPKTRSIANNKWNISDIENEFRAQIELGLKRVKQVSHLSFHMNCHKLDLEVENLCTELGKEYGLFDLEIGNQDIKQIRGYKGIFDHEERIDKFISSLHELNEGNYLFIDHPSFDSQEMRATKHNGYENVAEDRFSCLRVFTDPRVKQTIDDLGIELISYTDMKKKTVHNIKG